MSVHLAVISAGRPQNVERMHGLVGEDAWWYVRREDYEAYIEAGAHVVATADGLCGARNAALEDAASRGLPCVQVSDDLKGLALAQSKSNSDIVPMTFREAVLLLQVALSRTPGARLAGCAPTANAFYATPGRISTRAFIVGDLFVALPDSPVRFDERLRLKEDYDFTLAHIEEHGAVARVDDLLATFQHRTNAGGAVAVRTETLEQESIALLKQKWGDLVRDNPRRPNEVKLHLR